VKDGDETDVNCGGALCPKCSVGWDCKVNDDCFTGVCKNDVCGYGPASAGCSDNAQNGGETDVDCGGGACQGCAENKTCIHDSDCAKPLKCAGAPGMTTCQVVP
jgi:hypothetical protein